LNINSISSKARTFSDRILCDNGIIKEDQF
jgi:hypothetical protein